MRLTHADPVNLEQRIGILSRGFELLAQPLLNKDAAFSEAERDLFGLISKAENPLVISQHNAIRILDRYRHRITCGRIDDGQELLQVNNAFIFPGVGLGVIVSGALRCGTPATASINPQAEGNDSAHNCWFTQPACAISPASSEFLTSSPT